jgi:hypothetical protein
MTDMVDAVLMRHAFEKGIDPKSPQAPQTMYEAVRSLVNPHLQGGKLSSLDPKDSWLREFATKNLIIGITGAKRKADGLPCYTFVDNGEGQHPDNFERTFLSLSAGNKKSIPFVQGKYNMGSSGVLGYCGRKWFKLVVSRRYDGKAPWGWTLMRRRPDSHDAMPVVQYFVLSDRSVPRFEQDFLYPLNTSVGSVYEGTVLRTGTVVKLYDYNVGAKFLSFRGAREAFNENLVETILPFRLLDLRQTPDKKRSGDRALGVDPRPFYGMEFLLLRSHKEAELEDEDEAAAATDAALHVGDVQDPELGQISVSAIPLKPLEEQPSWLKDSKFRVFHCVNGQVQFKETRGYLSQSCKLPALKDRVVVIVDASNLGFGAHNEVWKGDREHTRNTILGERYKEAVADIIRNSESLKELQTQVARQELQRATKTQNNALFQKLLDQDRTLAGLLSGRSPEIRVPSSGGENGGEAGGGDFEGKRSPTYLRFEEKAARNGVEIPVNRTRPIACRTDAENGYLRRSVNRGEVLLPAELTDRFSIREQLHNGRLTLFLTPVPGRVTVDEVFKVSVGLIDPETPQAVETEGTIEIRIAREATAESEREKKEGERPKSGEGKNRQGDGKDAPLKGLPPCVLLTRDGREVKGYQVEQWPAGFTYEDGGFVEDLGEEGAIFKINLDNSYYMKYVQNERGEENKAVIASKYILGMRVLMLGFEQALRTSPKSDELAELAEEFRRAAARGAASTVLGIAQILPKIVNTASMSEEEVVE